MLSPAICPPLPPFLHGWRGGPLDGDVGGRRDYSADPRLDRLEANREKDEQKDIMALIVGAQRRAAKANVEATAIFVGAKASGRSPEQSKLV